MIRVAARTAATRSRRAGNTSRGFPGDRPTAGAQRAIEWLISMAVKGKVR